ncbi:MAG: hypothetical protein EOO62_02555 [Hymenobacter sp.]|nr:MAG: hypothetical protein EOO62_02555 [Hymenobacter sp.]
MLFVAYHPRTSQDKLGLPTFISHIFTEVFNEKKPMQAVFEKYSEEQIYYAPKTDGSPVPANRRLPPQLIMVCKGLKRIAFDFMASDSFEWLVSERFYALMQQRQLLADHYEACKLTVVSTKNQPLTDKPYYLLRFYHDDSALIDFAHSPTVPSTEAPLTPTTSPLLYYPDLVFKPSVQVPVMLHFRQNSFDFAFLCNEELKKLMEEEKFLGFDFYTLPAYVAERHYREQYPYGPPSDKPQRLS